MGKTVGSGQTRKGSEKPKAQALPPIRDQVSGWVTEYNAAASAGLDHWLKFLADVQPYVGTGEGQETQTAIAERMAKHKDCRYAASSIRTMISRGLKALDTIGVPTNANKRREFATALYGNKAQAERSNGSKGGKGSDETETPKPESHEPTSPNPTFSKALDAALDNRAKALGPTVVANNLARAFKALFGCSLYSVLTTMQDDDEPVKKTG